MDNLPTELAPGDTTKFLNGLGKWAVPPGTGGGITQLAQVVTSSSATLVTFSSIPAGYSALRIVFKGRDTKSAQLLLLSLKINSDATAANYTASQYLVGQSTSTGAGTNNASTSGLVVTDWTGVQSDADALAAGEILIPGYAETTFFKQVLTQSTVFGATGSSFQAIVSRFAIWASTVAITDLVFSTSGTAFVDGSTFTLYGMQ